MIESITAVEYNVLLSLIKFTEDTLSESLKLYGFNGINIDILPEYPRDLTKFTKPSIIVQKIFTSNDKMAMGNVIGAYYDSDSNTDYDAYAKLSSHEVQWTVVADDDSTRLRIADAIVETMFDAHTEFPFYNFIGTDGSLIDPTIPVSGMKIKEEPDVNILDVNDNKDYDSSVRATLDLVKAIVPTDVTLIDLSKGIKFTQTIRL